MFHAYGYVIVCFWLASRSSETLIPVSHISYIPQSVAQVHFPGSVPSSVALDKVNTILFNSGFTPTNTLFACSVCVDEINHEEDDITCLLKSSWGECFYLGGLAGVPFVGKTGFGAFSHHCPEDGNLFILFAPHVGISPNGEIGKYAREGQSGLDSACGAAVGAWKTICANPPVVGEVLDSDSMMFDHLDYQFQWIISQLRNHFPVISTAENAQAAIARAMYEVIQEFIDKISHSTSSGRLVVLGGIQINMPKPSEDFFQPLVFDVRDHLGNRESLMHAFA